MLSLSELFVFARTRRKAGEVQGIVGYLRMAMLSPHRLSSVTACMFVLEYVPSKGRTVSRLPLSPSPNSLFVRDCLRWTRGFGGLAIREADYFVCGPSSGAAALSSARGTCAVNVIHGQLVACDEREYKPFSGPKTTPTRTRFRSSSHELPACGMWFVHEMRTELRRMFSR